MLKVAAAYLWEIVSSIKGNGFKTSHLTLSGPELTGKSRGEHPVRADFVTSSIPKTSDTV
jgi:hypothetical protein